MEEVIKTWKKIGGGSLTLRNGKTVRATDGEWQAKESDIPKAFMRSVELIETVPTSEKHLTLKKKETPTRRRGVTQLKNTTLKSK